MKISSQLPKPIIEAINNNTLSPSQLAQLLFTRSISKHSDACFHSISAIYPFTNEPINQYLHNIDMQDKTVLTVASSGDQLLSAVNKGASFVSTFDISLLPEFYQELKIAALIKLNYKDFLNFFIGKQSFDNDVYAEIREVLTPKTRDFWDSLFDYYESSEIKNSQLFIDQDDTQKKVTTFNSYLSNEEEFNKTKENIHHVCFNFYNLDVLQLPIVLLRKYDVILLSNIPDYVDEIGHCPNDIANFFRRNLTCLLKENGYIIATMFGTDNNPCIGEDWEVTCYPKSVSTLTFKKRVHNLI